MSTTQDEPTRQRHPAKSRGAAEAALPIVVGVDGTPGSQTALRWAVEAARLRQLPLHVVLVADPPPATYHYPYSPPHAAETYMLQGPSPAHRTADDFERAMAYARDRLSADKVTGLHTPGRAVPVLLDASRDAAMIVVGSRGRTAITEALLGSVSATVASHASCPVVVIRGDDALEADRRVVVGLDGSKDAGYALDFAFTEAAVRKLPLQIIHCRPDTKRETGASDDEILARQLPKLAGALHVFSDRYPEVYVSTSLLREDPATQLVEESLAAELLVVGSRGRGQITGLLLGSVSQHLLQHGHCPDRKSVV